MTLHTRYRPASFDQVIGQDAAVKSLRHALKNKMSQTFLLVGPSGTGKTTLARIAAVEVGAKDKDILEIDAATYTGIDDMRTVTAGLMYHPLGGGTKAIIIDESHRLGAAAWSSLLKALEEPSSWVFWFLCTTELGKVPANIKTRCTSLTLKEVPDDDLRGLLEDVTKQEKLKIQEAIIDLCVREALGSPRQALVNLGLCASAADRKEAATLLKSATDSPEAFELAQALVARKPWIQIQNKLEQMQGLNAESVRQVIRAYVTKVILNANSERAAGNALEILDAFSSPFYSSDGISPVVLACGKVILLTET